MAPSAMLIQISPMELVVGSISTRWLNDWVAEVDGSSGGGGAGLCDILGSFDMSINASDHHKLDRRSPANRMGRNRIGRWHCIRPASRFKRPAPMSGIAAAKWLPE